MIDYKKRLTSHREFYPISDLNISFESDRGRIVSSSALRRLQKRTQVFALELNASIRTRLTHSLEVSQNARFIANIILQKLKEKDDLEKYGLEDFENIFISISEMTSLLHDIGNPPFGHFAEKTINNWVEKNLLGVLNDFKCKSKSAKKLKKLIKKDICDYDGNAQAIRVITKLQRLNLSYSQILSVLKYTRGAYESYKKDKALNYFKKKPGFYFSEKDIIEKIQGELGVTKGHRFPITYIMEAADDISYLTADLEDSVKKGILSFKQVYTLIKDKCEENEEKFLLNIVNKYYEKSKQDEEPYQFNMFFTLMRAELVRNLVFKVAQIYVDNHQAIFDGNFNSSLLDYDKNSEYYKAINILRNISVKYIYQNKEVQALELKGYKIVNALLDAYKPLLELSSSDFSRLIKDEKIDCFISMRLIKRISSKQIVAYRNDVKKVKLKDKEEYEILEWYHRVRLIIDFITGMTDDFALEEYKSLHALK